MTEEEWMAILNPEPMLAFLRGQVSDRKLRLFAVACCRRLWHLFTQDVCRVAVEVSERLADGLATNAERRAAALARPENDTGWQSGVASCAVGVPAMHAAERASANACCLAASSLGLPVFTNRINPAWTEAAATERKEQIPLLRCIFGNPFRPVAFDPRWRSESVVALATGIYAERAFDRLPVLADALEEAGCDHPDVLAHCRGPGPHARGCWVVDLVLNKS